MIRQITVYGKGEGHRLALRTRCRWYNWRGVIPAPFREGKGSMTRQQVSSGTIWEERYGYSRAVRVGNWIAVAGTTASDENSQIVGEGDPHAQAVYIFRKIERALVQLGAGLKDVIRVRMFVVEEAYWEPTALAMGEFFHDIRPASTLVVVKGLINPKMLVEIEVDAVIEG